MPSPKELALAYLEAAGRQDFGQVEGLLHSDVWCQGPSASWSSRLDFVASLKRMSAIHLRNELVRAFAEGDEVCLIYQFVTDTPLGKLPIIEWLRFREGRICSINLYYDRLPWQTVMEKLGHGVLTPEVTG